MRRLLIIAILCVAASAQTIVNVPGTTQYVVVARNASWSIYAGVGTYYLINNISPQVGYCVYIINNNPTNARTVNVGYAMTAEMSLTTYDTANPNARWVQPTAATTMTVSAKQTAALSVPVAGSAHAVIAFSSESGTAGGSPDTADILVVQSNFCPSGGNSSSPPSAPGAQLITGAPQWTISSAPASGSQATVANAARVGVRHTAQCMSASIASNAATTACAPQSVVIRDGVCGSGTVKWVVDLGVPATQNTTLPYSICGLNIIGTTGSAMCVEFGAADASCLETVSLAGIDQ